MTFQPAIIVTQPGAVCSACGRASDVALCRFCRFNIAETDRLARKIILTAGYAKANFGSFKARVMDMRATVIDIRFKPYSSMAEWQGEAMKAALGERYLHVKELGNENYGERSKGIKIHKLNAGIDRVLLIESPVVILCGCLRLALCHRRVIAEAITERGCFVSEWNLEQEAQFPAMKRGRLVSVR